ncbi:T9SS type A sorting domain-containing protein [Flavobacterium silvaticum]|uniref:T9SS type A sorting domain-containing protein n=1 Tax=Flavobacterium silvaticum TaxID=1852020 RepID=A0A972JIY3_9FLAO|nr:T9SS type A sorting domain-containing protein [Flavobacterium silvaticum]NMH27657.1 T9SS type A sorting domain-containing protein [Flavobacterium silvaticum]
MKHFYFLIFLITATAFSQSPQVSWVRTGGSDYSDGITALDKDQNGNIYVGGFYSNQAQFGNTILPNGSFTLFIAKYDAAGNLLWIKPFSNDNFVYINSVAADTDGNVAICGYSYIDFDLDPSENEFMATSDGDGFIAKYDPDGNFLWGGTINGQNAVTNDIDFDAAGNLYATGFFRESGDLDITDSQAVITGSLDQNAFLSAYAPDGTHLWGFGLVTDIDTTVGESLSVRDGFIALTGAFKGSSDFDPSAAEAIKASENTAAFVAKYTTDGAYVWAGILESTDPFTSISGKAVDMDADGNVYVFGNYTDPFDADPSENEVLVPGVVLYESLFLSKYDADGNYQWVVDSSDPDRSPWARHLAVDDAGNSAISGLFDEDITFKSFSGPDEITLTGSSDIYVALYDTDGQIKSAIAIGSDDEGFKQRQNDDAGGVILTNDTLYVGGQFTTTTNFAFPDRPPFEITISSEEYSQAFLAKYEVETLGIKDDGTASITGIYPNPAYDIVYLKGIDTPVELFDITGRKLSSYPAFTTQIDMSGLSSGAYLLKSVSASFKILKK